MAIKTLGGHEVPFYDEHPFADGNLFVFTNTFGPAGVVRAKTWVDAYEVCEDEFQPEADESIADLVAEYGEDWKDSDEFQEAYGFRPSGPNDRDEHKHGIYARDLNGESLDLLTLDIAARWEFSEFDIPSIED